MCSLKFARVLPWEEISENYIKFCDGTIIQVTPNEKLLLESYSFQFSPQWIERSEFITNLKRLGVVQILETFEVPVTLLLKITPGCNLKCKYCYAKSSPNKSHAAISWKIIQKTFDIFNQFQKLHVIFHGGEPTLYFESIIIPTLKKYSRQGLIWSIQSNGLRFSDFSFVKRYKAYLSMLSIGISIDGLKKDNFLRTFPNGSDSWEYVIKGIENLEMVNIPVGLLITLNNRSVHHIIDVVKFFSSSYKNIKLFRVKPLYSLEYPDLMPNGKEYDNQLSRLLKWVVQHNMDNPSNKVIISNFVEMVFLMYGILNSSCQLSPCAAGKNFFVIDYNGDVLSCDFFPIRLGNILNNFSFDKACNNKKLLSFWSYSSRRLRKPYNTTCGTCRYRVYCNGGGCPGIHSLMDERFYTYPGRFCLYQTWQTFEKFLITKGEAFFKSLLPDDLSKSLFAI